MKRQVKAAKSYELVLKDRLGNTISKPFFLQVGLNELETNLKKEYYQSNENEKFFIYEGIGILDLEKDCIQEFDFERLNFHFLNYFLGKNKHHKSADENDKKIINNFLSLLEFNLKNPTKYIKPFYYERIEKKLFDENKDKE